MANSKFNGGTPVTDPNNQHSHGAGLSPEDILPSLGVEERQHIAFDDLDAWGSTPATDDVAAGRPTDPPSFGGQQHEGE
jgi:hypothetical protein